MTKAKDGLPRVARNDEPADDAKPIDAVPMPEPEGGWPSDEFTGLAGCFVRDPFTGVRSRAVE